MNENFVLLGQAANEGHPLVVGLIFVAIVWGLGAYIFRDKKPDVYVPRGVVLQKVKR